MPTSSASTDPLQQQLPRRVVGRPGLERRLDDVPPGGLGLLVASAGSGKSVLVRQWQASRPGLRVAFLALTRRHEDAVVLAKDLVEAIRSVAPEIDPGLAQLVGRHGSALDEALVDAIRDGLATLRQDVVLVLEDAHALSGHPVCLELGRLFTTLPTTARGVVTTRRDLPWHLHRLRLDDRIVELRGTHLAFREREARALLEAVAQRELTDELVGKLVERTDGWAAGLQLAAISLRTAPDPPAFVESFAGSNHLVAEYLLDEVVERQGPEVRRFLLRTSVLDWLSPELCEAVTGTGNARAVLDELYHRSMFLIPLDESGRTFRYHHLFAEVLRYRLRVEDPGAVDGLQRRAARWLLLHGREAEAVDHLLDAGDTASAFAVVTSIGHRLFERGEATTLVRWLTTISRQDAGGPVAVEVNLLAAQLAADEATAAAETYRRIMGRGDVTSAGRAAAHALYAMLVTRGMPPERVLAVTDAVRDALSDPTADEAVDFLGLGGRDSAEVMGEYSSGLAHLLTGNLTAAATTLERVLALPGMSYPLWKVFALGSLALVRAWQGRGAEALGLARSALGDAEALGAPHHHGCTHAHQALALVALDRADLDGADEFLAHGRLDMRGRPASTVYTDVQLLLEARATAAREGPAAALAPLRAPAASGAEPALLAQARLRLRVSLLMGTGDLVGARALLQAPGRMPHDRSTHVDVALSSGDVAAARSVLEAWHPEPDDLRAVVRRHLRRFTVLDAGGDNRAARAALTEAVAAARGDRLRWPFLEVPSALRAVRHGAVQAPWLASDGLWETALRLWPVLRAGDALPEPLTPAERAVLVYLPGRMKNQEIAAEMYLSVNTIKTHVASIYRKLGVTERNEAVARAEDLGLL